MLNCKGIYTDSELHHFVGRVNKINENQFNKKIILNSVKIDNKNTYDTILVTDKDVNIEVFQTISGKIKLIEMNQARNLGNFDESIYYRSNKILNKAKLIKLESKVYSFTDRALNSIFTYIDNCINKIANDEVKSLYRVLILGYSDENVSGIKQTFSILGISYILAISGMHINLIFSIIASIFRFIAISKKLALIVQSLIILIYINILAFPISAVRAYVMILLMIISFLIRRSYDAKTALGVATLIALVNNIYVVQNLGFILSFGITLLVIVVNELKVGYLEKYLLLSFMILPLIGMVFYKLPTLFMIASFIFVPIATLILILGFSAVAISLVSSILSGYILIIGKIIGIGTMSIGKYISSFDFTTLIIGKQSIIKIVLIYTIIYFTYRYVNKKRWKLVIFAGLFIVLITKIHISTDYTVLDVGQGDCNIIRKNEKILMIDCGSSDVKNVGKYRVIPYLDYIGVNKIDYVFLTHMHSDHYSGIVELIENNKIKNLVLTFYGAPTEPYYQLVKLAKENNIRLINIYAGDEFNYGSIRMKCLHPYRNYIGENPNSYSMVLDTDIGGKKILLTGDLEAREEELIAKKLHKVDILKVGHHGSNTSSSVSFLDRLNPEFASISCGVNNKFGHPNKEVIIRLQKRGLNIDITKKRGQIIYKIGKRISKLLPMNLKE